MVKSKVTIGVCVRNCAATLRETIESIIYQDYPHELMEVIFVDDGSEDETLSVIYNYVPKMDMQVKVFHHKWKGLGSSRNIVISNASGDYIIWVDGDMTLPRDFIRKQVEFMDKNPNVGIAKARYGMGNAASLVAKLENVAFSVRSYRNELLDYELPGTGGSIYRIEAISQVGWFDKHLVGAGEDLDIAYRIASANWLIKYSEAFFFERREESWNDLWRKYVWYGYGNYFLYRKNRSIFALYKMIPPASFLAGLFYSFPAYRFTGQKMVFFLPLHFLFKSIAWFFGFILGYLDSSKVKDV